MFLKIKMQIIPPGVICYFPTRVISTVGLDGSKPITKVTISTLKFKKEKI